MGIKTVPHPPYSPDVAPCDFWLFHKLRGCRYETCEEMKEAVTKVIDTLTQEDFNGAFQKLLEQYKCIAAWGDYLEGGSSFMCVLSIKVPERKNSGHLFNDPRIYIYIYIYIYSLCYCYTSYEMIWPIPAIAGIGRHPTKAWLSQLVNFKNPNPNLYIYIYIYIYIF